MKTKRVGTMSMAIVLIGFGILIFIAQINKLSATELSIKFWPSILILLGGEILWFSFKEKKENENITIRYDVLSVFIVMIILGVNIFIYGLIETGAMNWIKTKIASETYNYELPFEEYVVGESIEKIIIDGPVHAKLTVRTDKSNKIISSGSVNITSDSEENAKKLLNDESININKSGNIIYISFEENIGHDYYFRNLNLTIPDNKKVEIKDGDSLDLITDNINNNLIIDNINNVDIRLNKNSNIKVETTVRNQEDLRGNVTWNITKIENDENPEYNPKYKGELVYGDGTNIINILNCYQVLVDEV